MGIEEDKRKLAEYISHLQKKALTFGGTIENIPTACGNYCILINMSSSLHTVYIPDNVRALNSSCVYEQNDVAFRNAMAKLKGKVKVLGGYGLEDTKYMFYNCVLDEVDISEMQASKVTEMMSMFESSRINTIRMGSLDMSSVINAGRMFDHCVAKSIDMSKVRTGSLVGAYEMFSGCSVDELKLDGVTTHNVTNMFGMFSTCTTSRLDLSHFDTSNVTNMREMFYKCNAPKLDLSSFDTSKVKYITNMFYDCKAELIDVRNFDISSVTDRLSLHSMFYNCIDNTVLSMPLYKYLIEGLPPEDDA